MALPAFRDVGATAFSANNVQNPTALSPALPTRQAGDLLLCLTASRSITATVATPSGWTVVSGFPLRSATTSGGSIYAFTKISDGTDAVPSVSWSGVTTGTNGDSCSATILSYSMLQAVLDGSGAATDAAVTTSITLPSVTTTAANSVRLGHVIRINDTAHTFTGGLANERVDVHTTSGTGHGTQISGEIRTTAGATGIATVTPSNSTSSRALAVSLALKAIPEVVFTDSRGGTVGLSGVAVATRAYADVAPATVALAGAASDDWSVGGGGPTYTDTPTGRLRVKA